MLLAPYIRFASDQHVDYPWLMEERIIYDYELLYIQDGEVAITVEDTMYHGGAGDVFLFRPGRRHSLEILSRSGFRQPHIHFDLIYQDDSPQVPVSFKNYPDMTEKERRMIRPDILGNFGVELPDKLRITDIHNFELLLLDVIYEYENHMPFSDLNAQSTFLRLWSFILRQHMWQEHTAAPLGDQLLLQIRSYLNTNTNCAITLDALAEQFNINKYYLVHLFRETFGLPPIQYHQRCRLEKAKNLILYSPFSMTQIADMLGFSCLSAFTRAFQNQYHVYPSFFRKSTAR